MSYFSLVPDASRRRGCQRPDLEVVSGPAEQLIDSPAAVVAELVALGCLAFLYHLQEFCAADPLHRSRFLRGGCNGAWRRGRGCFPRGASLLHRNFQFTEFESHVSRGHQFVNGKSRPSPGT